MIRHTVVFRLKHPAGSPAEADFLSAAEVLATIPGVERFEKLRQVSGKNDFDFGFSMEFADRATYDSYDSHPDHLPLRARALGCGSGGVPGDRLRSALSAPPCSGASSSRLARRHSGGCDGAL